MITLVSNTHLGLLKTLCFMICHYKKILFGFACAVFSCFKHLSFFFFLRFVVSFFPFFLEFVVVVVADNYIIFFCVLLDYHIICHQTKF